MVRVIPFPDTCKDFAEILKRHVGSDRRDMAVTAAVAAAQIAAQGALPEQLAQRMFLLLLLYQLAVELKCQTLFK